MIREDISNLLKECTAKEVVLELSTGYGKSKIALEYLNKYSPKSILIVIPRLILIDNWKDEIRKWGFEELIDKIIFSTYVSLHKHIDKVWDFVCYDECFSGETEILTNKGYKQFKTLTEDDLVAQWEDSGKISFVKPLRIIKRFYNGDICKVHLKRNRYVYMTPNHNQVYKTKRAQKWITKPIKDIKFHNETIIPISGIGTGNNEELSPMEKLFIAIQADGTLQRHQKEESVYSIQVTKERKKERLFNILNQTNNYTKIKGRIETDRYIVKLPKGDAKLLSTHFDINMGYERANSFINEVVSWDGSIINNKSMLYYSSKIKENSDFVAGVAIQAGYEVFQSIEVDNRKEHYSTIHRVFMKKRFEKSTQCIYKEYIPYNDYVYCVEVPSHKIVIRSEGVTFISGNCHHLSDRCKEVDLSIKSKYRLFLSATLKRELKYWINHYYPLSQFITVSLKEAIDNDVLPDPKVILIPLTLDNYNSTEILIKKNKKTSLIKECFYKERWKYMKLYNCHIKCTPQQYYNEISQEIEYWKKQSMFRKSFEFRWLKCCNDRLKWLSNQKSTIVITILKQLKDYRVLTFCNSIEQTELLGKYCINSKNKDAMKHLSMFNEGKIKHITACDMVNEGVNLANCKIGLFAAINSSEILVKQKNGRILRHKEPVIIIPYYKNTREEELVVKMLENYNKDLVQTITNLKDLKI